MGIVLTLLVKLNFTSKKVPGCKFNQGSLEALALTSIFLRRVVFISSSVCKHHIFSAVGFLPPRYGTVLVVAGSPVAMTEQEEVALATHYVFI